MIYLPGEWNIPQIYVVAFISSRYKNVDFIEYKNEFCSVLRGDIMYYSELVKKAINIMYEAHKEDFDKGGYPYVFHPFYLATQVDGECATCVALLHDLVEDHRDKYDFDYLIKEGFPLEVVDILRLLTHEKEVPYMEYIKSISKNQTAREVKIQDLKHNINIDRMDGIKSKKYSLYIKALEVLEEYDLNEQESVTKSDSRILKFKDARNMNNNSLNYDGSKWIYYPEFYTQYRYVLGTKGNKPIIVIGINPSTAGPNDLDNTMKSVDRLASNNGFDSYIMLNVYAQRATNPSDMDTIFNEKLHEENMEAFKWIFNNVKSPPIIWAAWGTNIYKRSYLKGCLKCIVDLSKSFNSKWYNAGELTEKGHPRHPLYLPKDTRFEPFDIDSYIKNL